MRLIHFGAVMSVAFFATSVCIALPPLTQMLSEAGIKDSSLVHSALNKRLAKLFSQAQNAQTQTATDQARVLKKRRRRIQNAQTQTATDQALQRLRDEIQRAVGPYRNFQDCRRAADADLENAKKSSICSEEALAHMGGIVREIAVWQLRYDLDLTGVPTKNCDDEELSACTVMCATNDPFCGCCADAKAVPFSEHP